MTAAGLRGALAATGIGLGALTVVLSRSVPRDPVDYRHIVVYIGIGWSFIGAGLVAWRRRPDNPIGLLLVAAGVIRFTSQIGWWGTGFAELMVGLGRNFFLAVVAHVIVVFPSGQLRSPLQRAIVWAAYGLAILGYVVPNAFDGTWDPNILFIRSSPNLVTGFGDVFDIAAVTIALFLVALVVHRWRRGSRPARRALSPLIWTAPVASVLAAADIGRDRLVSLPHALDSVLDWGGIATAAIPLALLVGLLGSRLHQGVVAKLLVRLERSADPSDVREALAETLGDPSLQLVFPLADDTWIDERGNKTVDPRAPGEGRALTNLSADGRTVATLVYDPFLLEEPELVASAASAARLTLENTRLQAELRAQLAEVRASRARIVEAGDAERRRLERNLHDGAQQRLLGIRLALSLARGHAGDPTEVEGLLAEAENELQEALEELRALARGIHPALLTDEGLPAALAALARRAAIPVEIDAPLGRLPTPVEQAAYYVASEALANIGKHAAASCAAVTVTRSNGTLVIEIADDGSGGADSANGTGLRGLRDRVEALEGTLAISSPLGGGTRVCAELPCG